MTPEDVNVEFYYGKRQCGSCYFYFTKKNKTLINYFIEKFKYFLEMLATS